MNELVAREIRLGAPPAGGRLGVPAGTYELVAPGELGWLMPSVNMDQHVDYSQPDYYIPGQDDPRHPFGERPRPDEPGYPRSGRRP